METRLSYTEIIAGNGGHNQLVLLADGRYGVGRVYKLTSYGELVGEFFDGQTYTDREAAQADFDRKEAAVMAYFNRYGTANE